MPEQAVSKKRESKPGFRRVMVSISEEDYKKLVSVANGQMREPNNMLSYVLKDRIAGILDEYAE